MKSFIILLLFLIPLVWSSYVNANYLSAKTFLIYFVSGLCLMALPSRLNIRKIPLSLGILLSMIFLYYVSFFFVEGEWDSVFYIFKMLSFVAITLFVYGQNVKLENFFENTSYLFLLMWAAIIGITGYEIFNYRILQDDIRTIAILSTFGNVNMMSEFFVLALPFYFLWVRFDRDRIPQVIKLFGLFAVSFILLYGRSRSAWLGLAAWFLYKAIKKEINLKEYIAFAAAGLLFFISHITAPDVSKISKFIPEAFSERASLYKGSLELLQNRPFGTPLGQFMNEIVPYLYNKESGPSEFAFFDQPHSEFLKWGIQFGWGFLALCVLFFGFLVFELRKRYKNEKEFSKPVSGFYIEFFLVLFPEMAFQFPFENPASILCIAVVLGLFLSSYREGIWLNLKYLNYLLGTLGFICVVNSFLFISSIHLESAFSPSPDVMNLVCRYYPINFRACFWRDRDLLTNKNIPAFRAEFQKDFRKNPLYCDNMRLLPEYFNYANAPKKTCEALLIYRDLYRNQTHFLPDSFAPCAGYSNPLKFENPEQWARDFKAWFEN